MEKIIFDFEICFMVADATPHNCEIHLLKFSSLYGGDVFVWVWVNDLDHSNSYNLREPRKTQAILSMQSD